MQISPIHKIRIILWLFLWFTYNQSLKTNLYIILRDGNDWHSLLKTRFLFTNIFLFNRSLNFLWWDSCRYPRYLYTEIWRSFTSARKMRCKIRFCSTNPRDTLFFNLLWAHLTENSWKLFKHLEIAKVVVIFDKPILGAALLHKINC